MDIVAVDFVGRPIRPGDTIVYPWRRGSSMGLHTMNVTQVNPEYVAGFNSIGRRTRVTNLKNVVVVVLPTPETAA